MVMMMTFLEEIPHLFTCGTFIYASSHSLDIPSVVLARSKDDFATIRISTRPNGLTGRQRRVAQSPRIPHNLCVSRDSDSSSKVDTRTYSFGGVYRVDRL